MSETSIEWTDKTWNPVTGCSKVSPGCAHCYAEGVAERFWSTQYPPVEIETCGPQGTITRSRQFTDVMEHDDRLNQPLSWKKPSRVFVNSMSDLFHEDVPDEFIDKVFAVMACAGKHTFQVLTKRAARMRTYMAGLSKAAPRLEVAARGLGWTTRFQGVDGREYSLVPWPLRNVWLGVSVENQHFADERIQLLRDTPAAVRFLSVEPMLGPVDFTCDTEVGPLCQLQPYESTPGIDWVIVGGESGAGARIFDLSWARSVVAQRKAASVPVFVKQLGGNPFVQTANFYGKGVNAHPYNMRYQLKSKKGGDMAEWPSDLRIREFPSEARG